MKREYRTEKGNLQVGLMPQTISVMGGFRPQGQSTAGALKVVRDAMVCFLQTLFSVTLYHH